jgi:pyrrolidone-carboxylate peptidase
MKIRLLTTISVLLASSAHLAFADGILITTFDPFAGRPENRSQAVGKIVQQKLAREGFEVTLCNLPVVYDAGAQAARKCYAEMARKPDVVLSLGEGSCETRIETRAYNLDDTPKLADNSGQLRKAQMILKKGPEHIALNIPAQAMF